MAKIGRPSAYTEKLADKICELIAGGMSVVKVCERKDMPSRSTVVRWLGDNASFQAKYTRAKELCAEFMASEMLDIADTPLLGVERTVKEDGKVEIKEGDMLGHRKLQIETRKWIAAKLLPKKYGDRLDLNHGGKIALTTEQTDAALAAAGLLPPKRHDG